MAGQPFIRSRFSATQGRFEFSSNLAPTHPRRTLRASRPLIPLADGSHLLDAWQQRLKATPGWTDIDAMHRHVVTMLSNPERYFWGFDAVFAQDLAADLDKITVPTLVLTNSGEDLFEASGRVVALRPDWAYACLDGGTHDIVDEQPEAWAAAVVSFLRQ